MENTCIHKLSLLTPSYLEHCDSVCVYIHSHIYQTKSKYWDKQIKENNANQNKNTPDFLVYINCSSICILWTQKYTVKQHFSIFRTITIDI